jgi:hypothetical protein
MINIKLSAFTQRGRQIPEIRVQRADLRLELESFGPFRDERIWAAID